MARLSGKGGSIAVAGTNYDFGKWEVEFDGDDPDVTNFNSGGCQENLEGIHKATITYEGPYNAGAMAITRGTAYAFTLRASAGVTWTVTARVKNTRITTDVKDAVRINGTAASTGAFTPSVS